MLIVETVSHKLYVFIFLIIVMVMIYIGIIPITIAVIIKLLCHRVKMKVVNTILKTPSILSSDLWFS